jgi:hypothetical protein
MDWRFVADHYSLRGDRSTARTSWFTALFLGLCLSRLTLADEPVSIPPAKPHHVQQTVERAIEYMQTESAAWLNTRKCAACHHVPMPLWTLSEAERQEYAIEKKFVADTTESLLGSRDKMSSAGNVCGAIPPSALALAAMPSHNL